MALTPEAIHSRLGQLMAAIPPMWGPNGEGYPTPEAQAWLGSLFALVETLDVADAMALRMTHIPDLSNRFTGTTAENAIYIIGRRALAKAELKAPSAAQAPSFQQGMHLMRRPQSAKFWLRQRAIS